MSRREPPPHPGPGKGQARQTTKTDPEKPPEPAWRQVPLQRRSDVREKMDREGRFQVTTPRVSKTLLAPPTRGEATARANPSLLRRVWWLAPLLALLLIGGILLLTSDAFTVSAAQTMVRGNQRVGTDQILQASKVDGASIFLLPRQAVAARVQGIEGIATAVVHAQLPASVVIEVQEEVPLVAWHVFSETVWLSASGARVPKAGDPPRLLLEDADGAARDLSGGTQVQKVVMRAKILEDLRTFQELRPDVTGLYYGRSEGIYFWAPEGYTVYLGDDGPLAPKLALLQATQREYVGRNRHPETIDLRSPGRALVR